MKKLLVLTLVLSIVSLANAGLVVFDPAATTASFNAVTGDVSLKGVVSGDTNIGIISDAVVLTQASIVLGAAMPTDASGFFFNVSDLFNAAAMSPSGNDGVIWTIGTYLSGVYPTAAGGTILSANVGPKCGAIYVFECDGDGVMLGNVTMIAPEPMTMILLGLGGLFLRRK